MTNLFNKLAITGVILCLGLTEGNLAQAATITATLTADNFYGLYYGQADSTGLTFVGRNEATSSHSPDTTPPIPSFCSGSFQWSCPEAWEFGVNPGDYLYVLAWDGGLVQSWIGEFKLPDGSSLLSNISDWEYMIASGNNPGYGGPLPPLATVAADIAGATWASPQASAPQGTAPWFTIPGISSSAQFIWHDTLASDSTSDDHYVIFRTKNPVVPSTSESIPEPASAVGLLTVSALGAASILKKKLTSSRKV